MLTITRKEDEKIIVYEESTGEVLVEIVLKEIRRSQVRIGVHALPHIRIDRMEVYTAKLAAPNVAPAST
jgi:sRNA-binding carbon storage regulator CsrA